jgi:hypothetical protein
MLEKFFNFLESSGLAMYLAYGIIGLLVLFAGWTGYNSYNRLQDPFWASDQARPFVAPPPPPKTLVQMLGEIQIFTIENLLALPDAMGVKIAGIFLSTDRSASHVLVAATGQAAQNYALGESLPTGQRVYKIFSDKVIFIQDGELSKSSFTFPGIDFPTQLPRGLFPGK